MEDIERTKFNICLIGDTGVGKTSICSVQSGEGFNENILATIGLNSFVNKYTIDGKEFIFKIFDTAGEERYKSLAPQSIHISDGFLVVFDVNEVKTFEELDNWMKCIEDEVDIRTKAVILVGNKIDIGKRKVSEEDAKNYAEKYKIKYYEASAKTGHNIKKIFEEVYNKVYQLYNYEKLKSKNQKDPKHKNSQKFEIKPEKKNKNEKEKKKCC